MATALDCELVVLCSGPLTSARAVIEGLGGDPRVTAVDIGPAATVDLPVLLTSDDPDARRGRATDTSLKYNLGLGVAALLDWRRMLFLDDDIAVPHTDHLLAAAGQLGDHDAVGLAVRGFPDNSVVCHAHRRRGAGQSTFVGSGALLVDPRRMPGFFPDVYNADWLFLADSVHRSRVAVSGHVMHSSFDPFADPRRAYSEEFGDVLAEGLYTLLDHGRWLEDAGLSFWASFLEDRGSLIKDVAQAWAAKPPHGKDRDAVLTALAAAEARLAEITDQACTDYVRSWRSDMRTWQGFVSSLRSSTRRGTTPVAALELLGCRSR
ncbi:MAG: hypothetical protein H7Y15_14135 [Pseudonocardia sp.]|nr:hypothetical protein [Pseudonocardia sp.]